MGYWMFREGQSVSTRRSVVQGRLEVLHRDSLPMQPVVQDSLSEVCVCGGACLEQQCECGVVSSIRFFLYFLNPKGCQGRSCRFGGRAKLQRGGFTGVASENVKSAVVGEHGADEGLRRRQVIGP